jgi:hypothetical protein
MFSRTAHVYDLVHEFKDYEAEADSLAALILERNRDARSLLGAVTCLFSSIGYLPTGADLDRAIGRMAAHLLSGGVLVLDGWVRPDSWRDPGRVDALSGGETGLAVGRVSRSWRDGGSHGAGDAVRRRHDRRHRDDRRAT